MKTKLFKNVLPALATLLVLLFAVSCENDRLGKKDGKATVNIKLTDAPAFDYDAVNIDIRGVRIGVSEDLDTGEGIWYDLNVPNPGIYNLLDYRNGEMVALAGGEVPAGKISQIRLILGDESNVVIEGVTYPLDTPSAHTSGLKLNLHQTLEAGLEYGFVMDFDAARSIIRKGNGPFSLKPVITTYAEAFGGSIEGIALPALDDTVGVSHVQLISVDGNDTLISLPRENDGYFLFHGLDPVAWNLTVFADTTTTFKDAVFNDIQVVEGVVHDLGVIELESE